MARDKVFRVRLTNRELEKLERNAQEQGISSAELIRDYIKRLPDLAALGASFAQRVRSTYPTQQA